MKEKYHKYLLAGFASIITLGAGYIWGFVSALNWVLKTAVERFGLVFNVNLGELAAAMLRYKNSIG